MTNDGRNEGFAPIPAARRWWNRYCHPRDGDPAVRARLRRCQSSTDAMTIPAAMELAKWLGVLQAGWENNPQWERALGLACVLAHVKEDIRERPMQIAGWKRFPDSRRESDGGHAPAGRGSRW